MKISITAGVIGRPNVGKSSVINSLCRNSTCVKVGGEAGVTRHLQEVQLDAKVKLIDSPGVVLGDSVDAYTEAILANAVKVSFVREVSKGGVERTDGMSRFTISSEQQKLNRSCF